MGSNRPICTCILAVLAIGSFAMGCGGSETTLGVEGAACYPNGTCNAGLVCISDECVVDDDCVPDCGDNECGLDPVCDRTSCGTCDDGFSCQAGECIAGNCVKDCTGRECGIDPVCGLSCGSCGDGQECQSGSCAEVCIADEFCNASCAADPDCVSPSVKIRVVDYQQNGSNVMAFISVTDANTGKALTGLADKIRVKENGTALSMESGLTIEPRAADYVWRTALLVDTSGSVMTSGGLSDMVDGIKYFAGLVSQTDSDSRTLGVAAFDGAADLRPFMHDPNSYDEDAMAFLHIPGQTEAVVDAFLQGDCDTNEDCTTHERPTCQGGLCIDKSTNLYGAVASAAHQISESWPWAIGIPKGSAIVVLTDGNDQAGRVTLEVALQNVDQSRSYIFAVGVKGETDQFALAQLGRDGTFMVDDFGDIQDALDDIWTVMDAAGKGTYLISYCTPKRSGQHEINISVDGYPEITSIPMDGQESASCDPDLALTSCQDKECGIGNNRFWCGSCAGTDDCFENTCETSWAFIKTTDWSDPGEFVNAFGALWNYYSDDAIYRSTDGLRWERVADGSPFYHSDSVRYVEFQDRLFAVNDYDVWSTSNGIDWREETSDFPVDMWSNMRSAFVYDGSIWVIARCVNYDGYEQVTAMQSDNGATWNVVADYLDISEYPEFAAVLDGKMWVFGDRAHYSTDGMNWTEADSPPKRVWQRGVVWNDRFWIECDENGLISFDGNNWRTENVHINGDERLLVWQDRLWACGDRGCGWLPVE